MEYDSIVALLLVFRFRFYFPAGFLKIFTERLVFEEIIITNSIFSRFFHCDAKFFAQSTGESLSVTWRLNVRRVRSEISLCHE